MNNTTPIKSLETFLCSLDIKYKQFNEVVFSKKTVRDWLIFASGGGMGIALNYLAEGDYLSSIALGMISVIGLYSSNHYTNHYTKSYKEPLKNSNS